MLWPFEIIRWIHIYHHSPEPNRSTSCKQIQFPLRYKHHKPETVFMLRGSTLDFFQLDSLNQAQEPKEKSLTSEATGSLKLNFSTISLISSSKPSSDSGCSGNKDHESQNQEITKIRNQKHQKCPLLLKRNRVTKRKGETKSKGAKLSRASKVQALAYKHTRDVTVTKTPAASPSWLRLLLR